MNDLAAAREWTNEHCERLVRRARSAAGSRGPVYAALKNALEIGRTLNVHGHPIAYRVSDEAAEYLYFRSFACPYTYDIAIQVVARNIGEGVVLHDRLKAFASMVLTGGLRRPTRRGRKRSDNWERDCEVLYLLETLTIHFGVQPTRNLDSTHAVSACDLVAEGFASAGQGMISYHTVRGIWNNNQLKEEIRVIRSLVGSRVQDRPPDFVLRCESPFGVSEN